MSLSPEKPRLRLGYVALTDSAPLLVAKACGFFAHEGLDVELSLEPSWANIRDKVCFGELDGAHMLAAMPLALTLGLGPLRLDMVTALSLSLNGNAITLSRALLDTIATQAPPASARRPIDAARLRPIIEQRKRSGATPVTLAHVYEFSNHNYQLRDWLAAGGIHPDRDIRLLVIPPARMVSSLAEGSIDGFCVGEPWNTLAARAGHGGIAITGYQIWNNAPEKVFGVTRDWAETYPRTHLAVLRALLAAGQWLATPDHQPQANALLRSTLLLQEPFEPLASNLPTPEFHHYAANLPWRSHALFLLTQMLRWGQITQPLDLRAVAEQVYQPSGYRAAAASLGYPTPAADWKSEGEHDAPWTPTDDLAPITLGPDRLLDGTRFDPADPLAYLSHLTVANLRVEMEHLRGMNTA
ncbi:MAG: CmpA/NrtA family ABC transporter substrate-binding protein [Thiotrichales bacterium]